MINKIIVLTQPRSGSTFFTSIVQSMMAGSLQDMYRSSEWYLLSELEQEENNSITPQADTIETTVIPTKQTDRVEVTMNFDNRLARFIEFCGPEYNKLIVADNLLKAFQEWHFNNDIVFRIFKLYIEHNHEYFDYLKTVSDIKIIHLVRENTLDMVISRRVAHESNLWHAYVDINEPFRVNIDLKLLSDSLIKEEYLTWFVDSNYPNALKINYSSLVGDFDKTMKSVSDFCGLNGNHTSSGLKKVNPFSKKDVIINYDEVVRFLSGTKNEWMLHY